MAPLRLSLSRVSTVPSSFFMAPPAAPCPQGSASSDSNAPVPAPTDFGTEQLIKFHFEMSDKVQLPERLEDPKQLPEYAV